MSPFLRLPLVAMAAVIVSTACARSSHEVPHAHAQAVRTDSASAELPLDVRLPQPIAEDAYSIFELAGEWTDQRGNVVALDDVAGDASVVALIYTSCKATCPLIVGALKRIEAAMPKDQQGLRFLLVSIDPDRDTPGRLAEWARQTGLDESRWTLLAGSDETVRELAVSLDVRYQQQQDGEIAHTNGFSIIDRRGYVRHAQPGYSDVEQAVRVLNAQLR